MTLGPEDAYGRRMTPVPSAAPAPQPVRRGAQVAANVLTAIGSVAFVGGFIVGAVMGAMPGGIEFGLGLVVSGIVAVGALILGIALVIGAVARLRTWWLPAAALAAGALVYGLGSAGVPRAIMWPLIRADLEQQSGTCPQRAALIYRITNCFELGGGEAYGLDNGFLDGSALLHLPPGAAPPPAPTPGAEGWLTREDLGDGWYLMVLPW